MIRYILSVILLAMASTAQAQWSFSNPPPCGCGCMVTGECKCKNCCERTGDPKWVAGNVKKQVAWTTVTPLSETGPAELGSKPLTLPLRPVVVKAVLGSDDHTHSCPNIACPYKRAMGVAAAWGGAGHSHNCPYCGTLQNDKDKFPRAVNTGIFQYSLPTTSYGTVTGGCVGANCPTPTNYVQDRWYPGKNLRGK